jgi:hypothetical protein
MAEVMNSSMIYLIHCKNLCKCHNVPPTHHNNKGKFFFKKKMLAKSVSSQRAVNRTDRNMVHPIQIRFVIQYASIVEVQRRISNLGSNKFK